MQYAARSSHYDYSKSFAEQIEDWKAGNFPKDDTFIVSGTPEIWKRIGFNSLPVTIDQTHVGYAIDNTKDADHYLGEEVVKDLPNLIKRPIAIMQSRTHPNRAVIVIRKENNGHQIIAAVEVDGFGNQNAKTIASNHVTSVLGKLNALRDLRDAIVNTVGGANELFYWNKKEAYALLHNAGHSLPGGLPREGFVSSIHDAGSNVNTKYNGQTDTPQFKRWFGKSKVVDEDGRPLIVYHGTEADFTVFDRTKGRSTMDIQGMFFSPYEIEAGGYGSKVGAYYLSIKRPAPEGLAYKALNMFKGQNNAGIKAREWLESKGYDGVKGYDEWIAFYPEQIKSATDNIGLFDPKNPDVPYSVRSSTKTDRELLEDRIKSLEKQGKLDQKELERLYETVYDLSVDLDKAGSDIKSHKATLEKTVEQLQKYQQQAETCHQIERETAEAPDAPDKPVKDGADDAAGRGGGFAENPVSRNLTNPILPTGRERCNIIQLKARRTRRRRKNHEALRLDTGSFVSQALRFLPSPDPGRG